jgi:hypothetical protein
VVVWGVVCEQHIGGIGLLRESGKSRQLRGRWRLFYVFEPERRGIAVVVEKPILFKLVIAT